MRRGFSLIELVFVIVVMGILAKFGTNLLMTVYRGYAASTVNNRLQVDAELALKQVSNRLQYRIKDSVIARDPGVAFGSLSSAPANVTVLEWIGYDIDGWLGTSRVGTAAEPVFNRPTWSGFIDISHPNAVLNAATVNAAYLQSPGTDTGLADGVIQALSVNGTDINDSTIYFTGANSNVETDYGWNGVQNFQDITAAHRVGTGALATGLYDITGSTFTNTDVYENYKLAWTAYALAIEGNDLALYYDYQPWMGETYLNNGRRVLLLQNVDTFKFAGIGETIKVQICVNEQNTLGGGQYAICKETAIF